jgi:hypothetical protein
VPHQKNSHMLNYLLLCYWFYSLKVVIFMLWSSALTPCGLHRRLGNTGLSVSCGWPTHGFLIGDIPLTHSHVQTTTSPHTLQWYLESRALKPEHEGKVLLQNIEINVTKLHDIKTKNIIFLVVSTLASKYLLQW